jgi:hypothetical protein
MTTQEFGDIVEASPVAKKSNRSTDLSVNFHEGYAAEWFMAVPEWFRAPLDIELTPRVSKDPVTGQRSTKMVWTEGRPIIYRFSVGDMLYSPESRVRITRKNKAILRPAYQKRPRRTNDQR